MLYKFHKSKSLVQMLHSTSFTCFHKSSYKFCTVKVIINDYSKFSLKTEYKQGQHMGVATGAMAIAFLGALVQYGH